MKQHITTHDLSALTPAQLETIYKWTETHSYPTLLSIGQMIEFIDEHTKYQFHIFRRMVDWKIVYEEKNYGKVLGEELCDSLWEAVKEILEKE